MLKPFSPTKPEGKWFDGLAYLNLALLYRGQGHTNNSNDHFCQASKCYTDYYNSSDLPDGWALVTEFFAASSLWAATSLAETLHHFVDKISTITGPDADTAQLAQAVDLYLRAANGEIVTHDADMAIVDGVSRAFFAILLLH